MATTIADYVTLARQDLGDPNPPAALISDADLDRHVLHAVREYELARPLEVVEAGTVTVGSRTIDLSVFPNLYRVFGLEYPTGQWPPSYLQYSVFGKTLTIAVDSPPDGSLGATCNLSCWERHTVSNVACTVDPADDECITAGAVSFAAQEIATRLVNTVNLGGPDVWARYRELALDKAAEFRGYLALIRAKVAANRLYAPVEPLQSRFAVQPLYQEPY